MLFEEGEAFVVGPTVAALKEVGVDVFFGIQNLVDLLQLLVSLPGGVDGEDFVVDAVDEQDRAGGVQGDDVGHFAEPHHLGHALTQAVWHRVVGGAVG